MPAATSRSSPGSPAAACDASPWGPMVWAAGRTLTVNRFSKGSTREESVTTARKLSVSPTWQLSGSWTLSVPMPFWRLGPT